MLVSEELVLAPLRPGYTFLALSLGVGYILALTRFLPEPFLDLICLNVRDSLLLG